jgi:hypothetical protein
MELALHHGDLHPYRGVVCKGVSYFAGAMEGGPYRLRVIEEEGGTRRLVSIVADDEAFCVRCEEAVLGKVRYEIE